MRIIKLEVGDWRSITKLVTVEFSPRLTIVAGPNESGKTSLRGALRAAFLESYKSKRQDVLSVRPWGTSLNSRVKVDFESGGHTWRIEKEFFRNKDGVALYRDGQIIAKDESAQNKLTECLGSAAEWIDVLWSLQGSMEFSKVSPSLQATLASAVKDALTPGVDWLEKKIGKEYERFWTPTGLVKADLKKVRVDEQAAEERLRVAEAALVEAERLTIEIDVQVNALAELEARHRDEAAKLAKWQSERGAWQQYEIGLAVIKEVAHEVFAVEKWLKSWLDHAAQVSKLWKDVQLHEGALRELKEKMGAQPSRDEIDGLERRKSFLEVCNRRALEAELAALRAPDKKALDEMKKLEQSRSRLEDAITGGEIKASLTALQALKVHLSRDGDEAEVVEVPAAGDLPWAVDTQFTMEIPGVARLHVEHQNASAEERRGQLDRLEVDLRALLSALGDDVSVQEAEQRFQRREVLQAQLRGASPGDYASLRSLVVDADVVEKMSFDERVVMLKELPGKIQEASARFAAQDKAFQANQAAFNKKARENPGGAFELSFKQLRTVALGAPATEVPTRMDVPDLASEAWITGAAAGDGLQPWRSKLEALNLKKGSLEKALVKPEGDEVTAELLSEKQRLVEQLDQERQSAATTVNQGLGVIRGKGDLYARKCEADEALEKARGVLRRTEIEASAFKLLHEALRESRNELQSDVVAPLTERVGKRFHTLTGGRYQAVKITPTFGVDGVVPLSIERAGLSDISFGTHEQLMFLVRLCLAEMLGENGESPVLVLDDNLVHTDASRMKQVCELLERAAEGVQVVVFTCHPERYRECAQATIFELGATPALG